MLSMKKDQSMVDEQDLEVDYPQGDQLDYLLAS